MDATVTLTIVKPELKIISSALPRGGVNVAYTGAAKAHGGFPPYKWTVESGTLPPGLTRSSDGSLLGTPTAGGSYPFVARVTDTEAVTLTLPQQLEIAKVLVPSFGSATVNAPQKARSQ